MKKIRNKYTVLCIAAALIVSAIMCGCSSKAADDKNESAAAETNVQSVSSDEDRTEPVPETEAHETQNRQDPYKVGIVFPSDSHAFYTAMLSRCDSSYPTDRCEVVCCSSEDNQEIQNAAIESLLDEGCDGIIVVPVTPEGAAPAIRKCNEKDIPVMTLDRQVISDECKVTAHVGTDYQSAGKTLAETMLKGLEEKFPDKELYNIVELVGTEGTSDSVLMSEGIEEVTEESPVINMLAVLDCEASGEAAETLASDCFEAFDRLDGFICHDDELALACISAYKRLEEKPEFPVICSFGGRTEACNAIKNGELYATVLHSPEMVEKAVETLCDYLDGQEAEGLQYCPVEIVDTENAGRLAEYGSTF